MKKLKKLLSLVLAMTMILSTGIFSVSAGAASYTDEKDIECLEAVQTLSELNIIVGKNDGSFDPNGIVTRAEMAKMLYVLANGGEDDGAKGYPDSGFTDIKGTWGENYINAAYALGLTAGTGNNQFSPNATITAAQVYKMLLNLIGYEDVRSGMTGSEWAQMALRLAVQTGLNEDVKVNYSEGMPRQYAAQAIYNAIDTFRVKLDDTGAYVEYDRNDAQPTVGERYLRLQTVEGVYLGNDEFSLDGEPESDGYIRVAEVRNGAETGKVVKMKSNADMELVGQLVKVMYKSERGSYSTNISYGMYPTGDSTVEPFEIVDDYDVDDMNNKKSKDAKVFVNGALVEKMTVDEVIDGDGLPNGTGDGIEIPASAYLNLIYNDGLKDEDGDISEYNAIAMITIPMLNEVTTLSSSTLSFADTLFTGLEVENNKTTLETDKSFDLDDSDIEYDIADDVEVDDVVVTWYNCQSDVLHVAKAETVVGEVTGITNDGDKIRVDGETYDFDGGDDESKLSPFCAYVDDDDMTKPSKIKNGTTYTLYLINGFYVAAEKGDHSGSSNDDYAVVTRAYEVGEELRLKLLTADGLEKTYYVDEFLGADVDDIKNVEGLKEEINDLIEKQPVVVAYTASDSKVTIDACSAQESLKKLVGSDYDPDDMGDDDGELAKTSGLFYKDSTGVVYGDFSDVKSKLSSAYLDTDAAIFFDEGTKGEDWEAYEYDDLDDEIKWSEISGATVYVVLDSDDIVCLAVFGADDVSPSASLSGVNYGYLVKDPVKNKNNIEYTIWNGEEEVTYEQDESSATGSKHAIVAYTLDDDMIDDMWVITNDISDKTFRNCVAAFGYITDVDGSRVKINVLKGLNGKSVDEEDMIENGSVLSVSTVSDSTLMTIKAADTDGVAGTTKLRKNNQVIVLVNEDDEIEFAVIDTDGYFNKGAFLKANKIDSKYEGINTPSDDNTACKHDKLTYAVEGNAITATCSECKKTRTATFEADAESEKGYTVSTSGKLDVDMTEKAAYKLDDSEVSDFSDPGEYTITLSVGEQTVELSVEKVCKHTELAYTTGTKDGARTLTATCNTCKESTVATIVIADSEDKVDVTTDNNTLFSADKVEITYEDADGNAVEPSAEVEWTAICKLGGKQVKLTHTVEASENP